jgi:cytochrome c553
MRKMPELMGKTMLIRVLLVTLALALVTDARASDSEGKRLAYVLGCVNCHHQTPRDIINAPPLVIVQEYSIEQFRVLLKTGVTSTGRNLADIGSIMGVVAIEQFSHLLDDEVTLLYDFLLKDWTQATAQQEESKIPGLYKFDEGAVE